MNGRSVSTGSPTSAPTSDGPAADVLEARDLVAGYGAVPVLHGIDLRVGPGELVALLGANGAGKTTTILTVAGLVTPTSGVLRVLGEDAPRRRRAVATTVVRRARNGVAVVPDDRGLVADLTVAEHLRLGRPRRGESLDDAQVHEWFPALERLHRRRAGLLSGGEQQMLAVARALVGRPRLLVIDELSMGLAPLVARHLLDVVRRIADETGAGVLVVEQHVQLALSVADRGYVLRRGRVVLEGPAAEIAEHRDDVATGYLD